MVELEDRGVSRKTAENVSQAMRESGVASEIYSKEVEVRDEKRILWFFRIDPSESKDSYYWRGFIQGFTCTIKGFQDIRRTVRNGSVADLSWDSGIKDGSRYCRDHVDLSLIKKREVPQPQRTTDSAPAPSRSDDVEYVRTYNDTRVRDEAPDPVNFSNKVSSRNQSFRDKQKKKKQWDKKRKPGRNSRWDDAG